jgi:AAA ATPase domain/Protein of unknown function (DUF3696)
MLTEYQFSNFKAFSGPATIPIKPITLIFGPNSSGKSSIFQSLFMLKQTVMGNFSSSEWLECNGPLVNLGKYADIIHGHNVNKEFSFKITLNRSEALWNLVPELDSLPEGSGLRRDDEINHRYAELFEIGEFNTIGIGITFLYDGKSSTKIRMIELYVGSDLRPLFTYQKDESLENDSGAYYLRKINFSHEFWKDVLLNNETVFNIAKGLQNVRFDVKSLSIFSDTLPSEIEKSLNFRPEDAAIITFSHRSFGVDHEFLYLRNCLPFDLRDCALEEIRNHMICSEDDSYNSGNLSLYTIAAAFAFKKYLERIVHIGPIRDRSPVMDYDQETIKRINQQLDLLDIGYQLNRVRYTSHADDIKDLYRTLLYDKKCNIHVGLKDVGVGVSQILPVILQCVASHGKTLLIEQPELHLHPALQTELGDVFINAMRRNTLLIETHSEHLILRILRRIRETAAGELPEGIRAITPNDVAVLYVKPGKDGSEVIHIPVNEDGEFDKPWPDGFFSERARELF